MEGASKMGNFHVLDHPLIQHKLTMIRQKDCGTKVFREVVNEISMLMAYEVSRDLPLEDVEIETPLVKTTLKTLAGKKVAIIPILRAGLEGIREKLPVPAPVDRNIYAMSTAERKEVGIDDLPSSLAEAIDCLKSDTVVKDALGGHIYSNFVEAKKFEWAAYRSQVTQWELDQYLKLF